MPPEVTDRDLAALLFTWQSRFLTLAQLRRAFWRDASPSTAAKRLIALRKAGLLGHQAFPWLSERLLYFASLRGNRLLADCGLLPQEWVRDVPRRLEELKPSLRHDLNLVDLRLGLEESGADGATWISDHQLRVQRWRVQQEGLGLGRVADGLFDFEAGGLPCRGLLEYEHAPYRKPQALAALSRLRSQHPQRSLFVVARSPERAETFRAWAEGFGAYNDAPGLALFSHYEAVAARGLKAGFVDLRGRPWEP